MNLDNLEELQQFRLEAIAEIERLKGVIAEANKILDEITGKLDPLKRTKFKCWRFTFCPSDCSECTTFRLREILCVEKSRSVKNEHTRI